MLLGCSIPAGTFMPEYKSTDSKCDSFADMLNKCRYACATGYDYVELSVGAINELDDAQRLMLKRIVDDGDFMLFCCNSFIPPEISICTDDITTIKAFVDTAMQRLASVGIKEVIFGSGYARKKPNHVNNEAAHRRIIDFLILCSDIGRKYDITTCVEPLNSTETNMINTLAEGAQFVREVNRDNIKLLPDLFHMCIEEEAPELLETYRDITAHLHASEAPGRVFPGKFGGAYLKRAAVIYKNSLNCAVTVECVFNDFEAEAKAAYDFMQSVFERQ